MTYRTPPEIAVAAVESGATKAALAPAQMLVASVLAGAYIAFAGLVGIVGTSGLDPKTWGTLPTLVFGAAFSLGLVLVIIAGSELLTGNMALLPLALMTRRTTASRVALSIVVVTIGNLIGSLLVAYLFAVKSGVIGGPHSVAGTPPALTFARLTTIATGKAVTDTHTQTFLRAIACNWLVCLGVWMAMAAQDVAGKILAIFFPITAFVAMGFDHVVANMFFLPAAVFAHVPGIGWGEVWRNLWVAYLGNFVGALVFVAGAYWFLHLRGRDLAAPADGPHPAGSPAPGRGASERGATSSTRGPAARTSGGRPAPRRR